MSFAALFAVIARENLSPGIMGLSISYALQVKTVTLVHVPGHITFRSRETLILGFVFTPPSFAHATCTVDYLSDLAGEDVLRYGDQHCGCGESERVQ